MTGSRGIPGSVLFIGATLIALAIVPLRSSLRIANLEDEILTALEPARDAAVGLASLHSRQMSRYQEFLLTGDTRARAAYRRLLDEEATVGESLQALLEPLDLDVRALVLPVFDAATAWQVGHVDALAVVDATLVDPARVTADRARYDDLVAAETELQAALGREVQAARARMEAERDTQGAITVALLLLALAGTLAVAGVARRLQGLIVESTTRQKEAIRTRRQVDAILAATADAVLSLDLEGKVDRLNAAAERLLGYTDAAARGREVHEVLHGLEAHAQGDCVVSEAVRSGAEVVGSEDDVRPRGGDETVPVLWSLRTLVDGRERRGAVLTLTDLTEIKEAEARLRSAIQAREEVMAVVSHDLRSPLGSVSAATELLLDVPLDEEKRRRHLQGIESATQRMNRLIEDLLDVASIDAGSFSIRPRRTDIRQLLSAVREAVDVEARERGVVVARVVQLEDPFCDLDPDRAAQALVNLASNALRHTPRGGKVTLAVSRDEGDVLLSVEDTGSGISSEHLPRIFDRFWRPEGARSRGAGLGLAIVKGIAVAHGGDAEVWSEVGTGSRFSLRIPLSTRPSPLAE